MSKSYDTLRKDNDLLTAYANALLDRIEALEEKLAANDLRASRATEGESILGERLWKKLARDAQGPVVQFGDGDNITKRIGAEDVPTRKSAGIGSRDITDLLPSLARKS